ncbi:hypothetical protein [Streptomyces sp. 35G-GA-8]|uniref:hypothetical protein n=1 Tax=Streptomyces sp. 35G-GA-8 TaxID=2939434 RepID=UPI00201F68CF|nr:hypothetical protein [Streptomyces sp. 35G-GA-8]MCL7377224.1 hypothetical protein [Streptomyces sp. 35G-GA-8]
MLDGEEHWNRVLADILLSRKIGTIHVKLVGDLISVTAQLDMAAIRSRRPALALDEIIEYDEKIGPLEEAYQEAWQAVQAAPDRERRWPELRKLEAALTAAVEGIADFARRQGVEVELYRFGEPGA